MLLTREDELRQVRCPADADTPEMPNVELQPVDDFPKAQWRRMSRLVLTLCKAAVELPCLSSQRFNTCCNGNACAVCASKLDASGTSSWLRWLAYPATMAPRYCKDPAQPRLLPYTAQLMR
jgi:hypothetical protein